MMYNMGFYTKNTINPKPLTEMSCIILMFLLYGIMDLL